MKLAHQIFLLSPAKLNGLRAQWVLREQADFDLARRLRATGVPLGELFSFMSGLYFRGKLAYAAAFGAPPAGLVGSWVISSTRGLVSPETRVNRQDVEALAATPIDPGDPVYLETLKRKARDLREAASADCAMILLGSIATQKYVAPLIEVFGEQLLFPIDFVGRGDLSRGGLLLRSVQSRVELSYAPLGRSPRRGARPPRLPPLMSGAGDQLAREQGNPLE